MKKDKERREKKKKDKNYNIIIIIHFINNQYWKGKNIAHLSKNNDEKNEITFDPNIRRSSHRKYQQKQNKRQRFQIIGCYPFDPK
jgi:hypothetical protein